MSDQGVSFRVLGAVAARSGGSDLKIPAPRQRALLARLLLDANQTVATSTLIDAIWGCAPPQHPESALHIVVSRLRRVLDTVAPRLVRAASGYRIEVDPDELDLTRAHTYLAAAQRATRNRDWAFAASLLDEALECWTGEPLSDVATAPFHGGAARQLREFQAGIVELRNSAYLQSGRDLEVLEDIESWIAANPWRERLRAQQMGALYRTGRQIEALGVYDDLRRRLYADFKVEPCAEIQLLHSRILCHDSALLEYRGDARDRHSTPVASPTGEAGPDEMLVAQLRGIAIDPTDIVIVEGGPGVEKDWLVVPIPRHVAARLGDDPHFEQRLPRSTLADSLAKASDWISDRARA